MESNMQSLVRILGAEPKKKEIEYKVQGNTVKIEMRTLKQSEMEEASLYQGEFEKAAILSYAILSLNGVPIASFENVKEWIEKEKMQPLEAVRKAIRELGTSVLNKLFAEYITLVAEDKKERGISENFF